MKKFLSLILAMAVIISFSACSKEEEIVEEEIPEEIIEETSEPEKVIETESVRIDGIYVDDSYTKDGVPLKMVYVFYTLSAKESNIKIDSFFTKMIINGTNEYDAETDTVSASAAKFAHGYYYSDSSATLYMGTEGGVLLTFEVPEADLAPGRTVTFRDHYVSAMGEIKMSTDDIVHCSNSEEIAEKADPEGYAYEKILREEADEETVKAVRNEMNGYYWTYYIGQTQYRIEFTAKNNFKLISSKGEEAFGIYSVRNGYIFCEYDEAFDADYFFAIPWDVADGYFALDGAESFNINK